MTTPEEAEVHRRVHVAVQGRTHAVSPSCHLTSIPAVRGHFNLSHSPQRREPTGRAPERRCRTHLLPVRRRPGSLSESELGWGCRDPQDQLPSLPVLAGCPINEEPACDLSTVGPSSLPKTHSVPLVPDFFNHRGRGRSPCPPERPAPNAKAGSGGPRRVGRWGIAPQSCQQFSTLPSWQSDPSHREGQPVGTPLVSSSSPTLPPTHIPPDP